MPVPPPQPPPCAARLCCCFNQSESLHREAYNTVFREFDVDYNWTPEYYDELQNKVQYILIVGLPFSSSRYRTSLLNLLFVGRVRYAQHTSYRNALASLLLCILTVTGTAFITYFLPVIHGCFGRETYRRDCIEKSPPGFGTDAAVLECECM